MSYGGTDEAERLARIARGEECPHLATLDLYTMGNPEGVSLCTKCGKSLGAVVEPDADEP